MYPLLKKAINDVRSGDLNWMTSDFTEWINNRSISFLNTEEPDKEMVEDIYAILILSNILYNNTTMEILPLEDSIYDMVVVKYDNITGGYSPVGAEPITFDGMTSNIHVQEDANTKSNELPKIFHHYRNDDENRPLFYDEIMSPNTPMQGWFGSENDTMLIAKKKQDVSHKYPELAGTLYKCKYVLRHDVNENGISDINVSNVPVFEDTLHSWYGAAMANGINLNQLVLELKYDGVAVDLELDGDTVISAWSRGDTERDKAADLTPIFGGMKFPNAYPVQKGTVFGLQTECIITFENMMLLCTQYGKSYKNPRNAIIGLLGSLDARKYLPYFTLVPIRTSGLNFDNREVEIAFLNKYYTMGVNMKYAVINGDYAQLLFQVHSFVNMAQDMSPSVPFLYDGVVVSVTDERLKDILGRKNSVNKWSMAIKFETSKKKTIFTHYTFSVGQNGVVTPKAWFKPVAFIGTIHNNTTAHSYQRFKELALKPGDIVQIEYRNEVICYITKNNTDPYNMANPNKEYPFPTVCPSCGTPLIFSEKSATCPNPYCEERNISRIANMLKKLSLKGFSERYVELLKLTSFKKFLTYKEKDAKNILGDIMGEKFMHLIEEFNATLYDDFMVIGAIGFTSIAQKYWEIILRKVHLDSIINFSDEDLYFTLQGIKGIGSNMANTIVKERKYLHEDIVTIRNLSNIKLSYNTVKEDKPEVRFTGIRDVDLVNAFNSIGYDADGKKGVTKKTAILIIPHEGFSSNKMKQVDLNKCMILTPEGAWRMLRSYGVIKK